MDELMMEPEEGPTGNSTWSELGTEFKYMFLTAMLFVALVTVAGTGLSWIPFAKHNPDFNISVVQHPQDPNISEKFDSKDAQVIWKDLGGATFTTGSIWGGVPKPSCIGVLFTPYLPSQAEFFFDRPAVRSKDCFSGRENVIITVGYSARPEVVFSHLMALVSPLWSEAEKAGIKGTHVIPYEDNLLKIHYPEITMGATAYAEKRLAPRLLSSVTPASNKEEWLKLLTVTVYLLFGIGVLGTSAFVDKKYLGGRLIDLAYAFILAVPTMVSYVAFRDRGRVGAQYFFSVVWIVVLVFFLYQSWVADWVFELRNLEILNFAFGE
jgi:hypothetical protein